MLVAPTERGAIAALGKSSSLPEKFGADVLWFARGKKWGVQRKEVKDLRASVEDGRLGKEVGQARAAGVHLVVAVEGRVHWSTDGVWMDPWGRPWNKHGWWGVQVAVQNMGAWVVWTEDAQDTAAFIRGHQLWTEKARHESLMSRPGPKGVWGTQATNRDFAVHLLTSFPGVGVELAGRMYDAFGRAPLKWDVGEDELAQVAGLGKGKIRKLLEVLK